MVVVHVVMNTAMLLRLAVSMIWTDWLVNRRHCTQQCPAILTVIRDKVAKTVGETRAELPGENEIQQLLESPRE